MKNYVRNLILLCIVLIPGISKIFPAIDVEMATGFYFLHQHSQLYLRETGIENYITQYAHELGLNSMSVKDLNPIKSLFPINARLNIEIIDQWFLTLGVENHQRQSDSTMNFQVPKPAVTEQHYFGLSYALNTFNTLIGVEKRFGDFSAHALVGLAFCKLDHTYNYRFQENDYEQTIESMYQLKKNNPIFIIGAKYYLLNSFFRSEKPNPTIFIKLDYVLLRINQFTGSKVSTGTNSLGESFSEEVKGTVYQYETSAYGNDWFSYWELFENAPSGSLIKNSTPLSLDLSGLRIFAGISLGF
jgi:hypothetical protein